MNRLAILTALAAGLLLTGANAFAGGEHAAAAEDDPAPHAVFAQTIWTDELEILVQHTPLWAYSSGDFSVTLTRLAQNAPVALDFVTLVFTGADGRAQEFRLEAAAPGVFTRSLGLADAGVYRFEVRLSGGGLLAAPRLDDVVVAASEEAVVVPDAPVHEPIRFLKKQQWLLPFETTSAQRREVKQSVWAIGKVLPAPASYVEIVAPADGMIEVASAEDLALPGAWVQPGDLLVRIAPALTGDGWLESRQAFAQAEREWQRAQRLREHEAISETEFERLRGEYRTLRAAQERVAGSDRGLALTAPIAGQIVEWNVRPGRRVEAGDRLMAVADPRTVWLQVDVYENDYRGLATPVGAYVGASGRGWTVPEGDLRVLSRGGALEPTTRTVPILLEIANPDGRLTLNESTPVELYAGDGTQATAVPRSAVYDDQGADVVYVQTGGETFERRAVRLGPATGDWVSVLSGVEPGERVVSRGGYHIKLASTTAEIGHGHAH
jgi:RND family efflux transporter MFP subunit